MTENGMSGTRRDELTRGWGTLLSATLAYGATSPLFSYTGHYFVVPIEKATGWSRGEIALGTSLNLLLVAVALPLVGLLTDRYGPRKVAMLSVVGYAASLLLLASLRVQLTGFYAILLLAALFVPGTSVVVYARLVTREFVKLRGTAIAVMLCGTAIMLGPLAPFLVETLAEDGWRAGYMLLGILALIVGLPMTYIASRKAPGPEQPKAASAPSTGVTLRQAAATSTYWRLAIAIAAAAIPLGGVLNQLSPILISKGLTLGETAVLGSFFVFAVVGGRVLVGALLDITNPALVSAAVMLIAAAVMMLFYSASASFWVCALLVAACGAAMGAEGDLQAFFTARLFGFANYSAILGSIATFITAGLAAGAFLFGSLYDHYQNYDVAIWLSIFLYIASALSFGSLFRQPPYDSGASPLA